MTGSMVATLFPSGIMLTWSQTSAIRGTGLRPLALGPTLVSGSGGLARIELANWPSRLMGFIHLLCVSVLFKIRGLAKRFVLDTRGSKKTFLRVVLRTDGIYIHHVHYN